MDRFKVMSLASIAIVGALAVFLNLKSITKRLKEPFHLLPPGTSGMRKEENEAQQMLALQIQDTDGDGLTDYEELQVTHTSPFIPDTDSDGVSDGEEVEKGENPNCPKGKDCAMVLSAPSPGDNSKPSPGDQSVLNPMDIKDPAQMRKLIAETGIISKEELNKMDDAAIVGAWSEALKTLIGGGGGGKVVEGQGSEAGNMSAEELRKLLEQAGMSQELLKNIDDETLLKVYKEEVINKK